MPATPTKAAKIATVWKDCAALAAASTKDVKEKVKGLSGVGWQMVERLRIALHRHLHGPSSPPAAA